MNPMISKLLFTTPALLHSAVSEQLHRCGETEGSFWNEELNLTQEE